MDHKNRSGIIADCGLRVVLHMKYMNNLLSIALAVPFVGSLLWLISDHGLLGNITENQIAPWYTSELLESVTCRQVHVDGDGKASLIPVPDSESVCVANATCGLLYFPLERKNVLARVMAAINDENISTGGVIDIVIGGRNDGDGDADADISHVITNSENNNALAYLIQSHKRNTEDHHLSDNKESSEDNQLNSIVPINPFVQENHVQRILKAINAQCRTAYETSTMHLSEQLWDLVSNYRYTDSWNMTAAQKLLTGGADVNYRTFPMGKTLLMRALEEGNKHAVKRIGQLVDTHNDPDLVDVTGSTALHHACSTFQMVEIVEMVNLTATMCNKHVSCINAQDNVGRTPLATCIEFMSMHIQPKGSLHHPHVEAARVLLEVHDANPNIVDKFHRSPLMIASRHKLVEIVDLLIGHSENRGHSRLELDAVDVHGSTALMFAVEWFGWASTVSLSLLVSEDRKSFADFPSFRGVEELCTNSMSNNEGDPHLVRVVEALVECKFLTRTAKSILSAGARVNTTNHRGENALHIAHPLMVQALNVSLNLTEIMGNQWQTAMNSTSKIGRTPNVHWSLRKQPSNKAFLEQVSDCDIPSVDIQDIDPETFRRDYLGGNMPLLVRGISERATRLAHQTWGNQGWLNKKAGSFKVFAGVVPYPRQFGVEFKQMSLGQYLNNTGLRKGSIPGISNGIPQLYLFHLVDLVVGSPQHYGILSEALLETAKDIIGNSLGGGSFFLESAQLYVGGKGTGAPMHFHSNAINFLLKGSKKWYFLAPGMAKLSRTHPLKWKDKDFEQVLTCNQPSSSLVFVPRGWSHAVTNNYIDENGDTTQVIGATVEFVDMGSREAKNRYLDFLSGMNPLAFDQNMHRIFAI